MFKVSRSGKHTVFFPAKPEPHREQYIEHAVPFLCNILAISCWCHIWTVLITNLGFESQSSFVWTYSSLYCLKSSQRQQECLQNRHRNDKCSNNTINIIFYNLSSGIFIEFRPKKHESLIFWCPRLRKNKAKMQKIKGRHTHNWLWNQTTGIREWFHISVWICCLHFWP